MAYRYLAGAVALFHVVFVLFVVFGALLLLRWPQLAWAHAPALSWGATVQWSALACPLTPLEDHLRIAAGLAPYRGGFIETHILNLLYPAGLSRGSQVALGFFAVLLNVAVYAALWQGRRQRRTPVS